MTTQGTDRWQEMFQMSAGELRKFFTGESKDDPQALAKAKLATTVLSAYTRHEATESAREQTAVIIARELAQDKEQLQQYIEASVPRMGKVMASLPEGSGDDGKTGVVGRYARSGEKKKTK